MHLAERVALVTGAGRRLGKAIALALAERGAHVAVHYCHSEAGAQDTVAHIRAMGRRAAAIRADQADPAQIRAAVRQAEDALGPIDVLVNSAAIFERAPFLDSDEAGWDRHMNVNLRGPYVFSLAASQGMRERGRGKIVNIVDTAAERPWPGYLAYSVSKAGLAALTRGMARALAPEVQVNGVAPGVILPPEEWTEDELAKALRQVPMKKAGAAEDVAAAVCFLVEGPDYITGAILPVDGGRSTL